MLDANLGIHNIPMDIGAAMQFYALGCMHITFNAPRKQYAIDQIEPPPPHPSCLPPPLQMLPSPSHPHVDPSTMQMQSFEAAAGGSLSVQDFRDLHTQLSPIIKKAMYDMIVAGAHSQAPHLRLTWL